MPEASTAKSAGGADQYVPEWPGCHGQDSGLDFLTSNVPRNGPGSAARTANASSLGGVGGVLPGGSYRPLAEKWQQQEDWLPRKMEKKSMESETYGLTAQEVREEVRRIWASLDVDVQHQMGWRACDEEHRKTQ